MKCLITGVTGIVGRSLFPLLLQDDKIIDLVGITRKAKCMYASCDHMNGKYLECYEDLSVMANCVSLFKPDVIYNLAATSTTNSPAETTWKNTNITLNLLEECRKLDKPVRFIQASSINVENDPWSVYTCSKKACEDLVESYTDLYDNIDGLIVRFCAVVGSNNNHGLLADLVKKVQAEGSTIELFGICPGSKKPYIYVKDLAEMLHKLLTSTPSLYNTLTLCSADSIDVLKIAKIVMDKLDINKEIVWNPSKVWKGDQRYVDYNHNDTLRYFREYAYTTSGLAIYSALNDILRENKNE